MDTQRIGEWTRDAEPHYECSEFIACRRGAPTPAPWRRGNAGAGRCDACMRAVFGVAKVRRAVTDAARDAAGKVGAK